MLRTDDFEVFVRSNNEIQLYNRRENVTYFLVGYLINNFDYDKLFYENIEYFLQEYKAWEKINTTGGTPNAFDNEKDLEYVYSNRIGIPNCKLCSKYCPIWKKDSLVNKKTTRNCQIVIIVITTFSLEVLR